MEELTKLMHEMWFNNEISKEAYAKLLIFTNTHNTLQLLQTDVSISLTDTYKLANNYTEEQFIQMMNHLK